MKLKWIQLKGMIYVADPEDDYDHCRRCVFNDELASEIYCRQVSCQENVYIPLEPQHIPNLRKVGKTKWQD